MEPCPLHPCYLQCEVQVARPEIQDPQVFHRHRPLPLDTPCAPAMFQWLFLSPYPWISKPSVVSRAEFSSNFSFENTVLFQGSPPMPSIPTRLPQPSNQVSWAPTVLLLCLDHNTDLVFFTLSDPTLSAHWGLVHCFILSTHHCK